MSAKKKIRIWLGIPLGILLIAAISFGGYVAYYGYTLKALPGYSVGDISVSGKTEAQIVKELNGVNDTAAIKIENADNKTVKIKDLGYQIDARATARKVISTAGNSFKSYITALFINHKITPITNINPTKAVKISNNLSEGKTEYKAAVQPGVKFDEKANKFTVVAGKEGYGYSSHALLNAAKQAAIEGKTVTSKITFGSIQPLGTTEQANELAKAANELISPTVTVKYHDKIFVPEAKVKAEWVTIPSVLDDKRPSLVQDKIAKWVTSQADDVNVQKKDGKRYITQSGKVLKTESRPKDGVEVNNIKNVSEAIYKDLSVAKNYTGDFITSVVKAKMTEKIVADGAEDLPYLPGPEEKWVDVNLTDHTVAAYIGAKRVRGPNLMGHGKASTPTVTGVYHTYLKRLKQDMTGLNEDGTRYFAPGITYIQYFYLGYALHAWPGHKEFGWGGGSYGSHGCVNMPESLAKWYYDWAPLGTAVVSHY